MNAGIFFFFSSFSLRIIYHHQHCLVCRYIHWITLSFFVHRFGFIDVAVLIKSHYCSTDTFLRRLPFSKTNEKKKSMLNNEHVIERIAFPVELFVFFWCVNIICVCDERNIIAVAYSKNIFFMDLLIYINLSLRKAHAFWQSNAETLEELFYLWNLSRSHTHKSSKEQCNLSFELSSFHPSCNSLPAIGLTNLCRGAQNKKKLAQRTRKKNAWKKTAKWISLCWSEQTTEKKNRRIRVSHSMKYRTDVNDKTNCCFVFFFLSFFRYLFICLTAFKTIRCFLRATIIWWFAL